MKVVEMLLVKDEADRYLSRWLDRIGRVCDEIVALDNGSTDNTVEMLMSNPKVVMVERDESNFYENERKLRTKLWEMALSRDPTWVQAFDADEFPDNSMDRRMRWLTNERNNMWWSFRFFHFWGSETRYRVDKLWNPHVGNVGPRMARITPGTVDEFFNRDFACGSIPVSITRKHRGAFCGIRIKHLGYARQCDIIRKGQEYLEKDGGKSHAADHIKSILDETVETRQWIE